jgi:crotonobetainyl-CoA:carnitine CoA-transferase CaiB-like acyl-CoA transferase
MPAGPLDGVRVLDVTNTFMGPYATLLLAQQGADVLKVEPPAGDVLRRINDARGTRMGPIFLNTNRGKRSVVVDLGSADGAALFARLVTAHDVLVHNVLPRAAARLGLTFDAVRAHNPRIVHCALNGFGAGGPYHGRPAYDDVIQAASGLAASQGGTGEPEYVRSVVADKIAGLMATGSINAALYRRSVSGEAQSVEVPMLETLAAFTALEQQGGYVYSPPRGPAGYARTASPHRIPYATADGHLSITIYTDAHWRSFFALAGKPELADDPRYATITGRTTHIDELYAMVADVLPCRSTAEWRAALEGAGIPVMPVNPLAGVPDDEHLAAVGLFETLEHPTEGTLRVARHPVGHSSGRPELRPAPALGEHTAEVLAELGYPQPEVERLTGAGGACAATE